MGGEGGVNPWFSDKKMYEFPQENQKTAFDTLILKFNQPCLEILKFGVAHTPKMMLHTFLNGVAGIRKIMLPHS